MATARLLLPMRWRTTIRIGVGVGIAGAGLASLGWYVVERTGGPLQIPAHVLSMMALPEAAAAERPIVRQLGKGLQ